MKQTITNPRFHLADLTWPRHLVVIALFVVLTLVLVAASVLARDGTVWETLALAADATNNQYAERVYLDRVIRTGANSWSNLAYVLAGFYFIALAAVDRKRRGEGTGFLLRQPILSVLYGATSIFLGFGSFFFHASLTRIGQQFDVAGMYAVLLSMVAIAASRMIAQIPFVRTRVPDRDVARLWVLLALVGSVLGFIYKWELSSNMVLGVLAGIVTVFTVPDLFIKRYTTYRWAPAFSIASFVVAFVIRELDIADHFSGPDSVFQGHAVWHLLTSAGFVLMYLYYRSETEVDRTHE